jgi:hypothetical protein
MRNDLGIALVILALIVGALVGYLVFRDSGPAARSDGAARVERSQPAERPAAPGATAPSSPVESGRERARIGVEAQPRGDGARVDIQAERGAPAQRGS